MELTGRDDKPIYLPYERVISIEDAECETNDGDWKTEVNVQSGRSRLCYCVKESFATVRLRYEEEKERWLTCRRNH